MSHYDEQREAEYVERRQEQRKRVAAKGKSLLNGLDMFRGADLGTEVFIKENELRAAILAEMYRVKALVINGE